MYFGYWLQSPDPDDDSTMYDFATFFGGNAIAANVFAVHVDLTDEVGDALTATYVGGAAGRYVTRKLQVDGSRGVDPNSPGYTGRFTATATLTAHFGDHEEFDADEDAGTVARRNSIGGTITDFMDGTGTNLGFINKVTLERTVGNIQDGAVGVTTGMTMATFDETDTNTFAKGSGYMERSILRSQC